jgi:hypothetical protein
MRYANFLLCSFLLCACTIAPKPVETNSISYVGNAQDAGIVRFVYDAQGHATGVLVRPEYVTTYRWLLSRDGAKLKPPMTVPVSVVPDEGFFIVSLQDAADYARMVQIEKQPQPAPKP